MKTTLRDIVLAVRYGDAALVGESAGYLILGVADLCFEVPRRVSLDAVFVEDDGVVGIDASPCTFQEAEASHRQVLSLLLQLVRTPCPNLERVATRQETRGVDGLIAELESALVPVNRKAAKRSLARLVREAKKATARMGVLAEVEPVIAEEVRPAPAPVTAAVAPFESLEVDVQELESDTPTAVAPQAVSFEASPVEVADADVLDLDEQSFVSEPLPPATVAPSRPAVVSSQVVGLRETVEGSARKPSSAAMSLLAREYCAHTPLGGRTEAVTDADPALLVVESSADLKSGPDSVSLARPEATAKSSHHAEMLDQSAALVVDELDDAPTQIFAAAHVEERTAFVERPEHLGASHEAQKTAAESIKAVQRGPLVVSRAATPVPAKLSESPIPPSTTRMREPLPAHLSLIPGCAKKAVRRPSDIQELLDRMPTNVQPDDELYAGLKLLSRIDLSPIAPPVAWLEAKA